MTFFWLSPTLKIVYSAAENSICRRSSGEIKIPFRDLLCRHGILPSLERILLFAAFFTTLSSFTFTADLRVFERKTDAVIEEW